jgi:hypothetical protein
MTMTNEERLRKQRKRWHKHKETINRRRREKYATDPEERKKRREQAKKKQVK